MFQQNDSQQQQPTVVLQLGTLIRQNAWLVISGVCLVVFMLLLVDVLEGEFIKLDRAAYWLIVQHLRTPWLTPFMDSFSALAMPVTLLVFLLVGATFAPKKCLVWCCAVNLVLVVVLNQIMKFIIQRPRPDGFRLATASGFSFPSGHSMVAMAFFGLLMWLVWHHERDRRARIGLTCAFGFIIVAIGVSRVYLGVHYASDVIAGFCVSGVWLALYTHVGVPLFMRQNRPLRPEKKNHPRP